MASSSWISESDDRQQIYSRKQKSLGLLCTNFIGLYDRGDVDSISLDDAAKKLGVERRRIYDIVNVMESVGALARKAKNRYSWIGFSGIPAALEELKEEALGGISCNSREKFSQNSDDEDDEKSFDQSWYTKEDRTGSCLHSNRSDQKREKSLGHLTQNFVKLFLTSDMETISLDEAARLLLGEGLDAAQTKNNNAAKVRRLYDIANVLSSMNLIEKTSQAVTRKPAFRWLGAQVVKQDSGVSAAIPPSKGTNSSGKRIFGTEITNSECKRSKPNSHTGHKPMKAFSKQDDLRECHVEVQKHSQGSKGYVFGPFQPSGQVKLEGSKADRDAKKIQDWESLASPCHLQYRNQALTDLFGHYVEAWNSWFQELAGGSGERRRVASASGWLR